MTGELDCYWNNFLQYLPNPDTGRSSMVLPEKSIPQSLRGITHWKSNQSKWTSSIARGCDFRGIVFKPVNWSCSHPVDNYCYYRPPDKVLGRSSIQAFWLLILVSYLAMGVSEPLPEVSGGCNYHIIISCSCLFAGLRLTEVICSEFSSLVNKSFCLLIPLPGSIPHLRNLV